jgi:hypothetical protein
LLAPAHAEEAHHHDGEGGHSRHEAEADGLRALHAWTRATSGRTSLIFVEIENNSAGTVSIVGGHADWADAVELVGFRLKDGEPTWVALPPVPVKAGTAMMLAPDGLALRAVGVKQALVQGEEHEIEIEFDSGHLDMVVQVEAVDARAHSHAGHQH